MGKNVLITGGAGFIGSHVADELIARGHHVRALDNLSEQVHGPRAGRPSYLNPQVELVIGDVRDRERLRQALHGIDAVYHFAALVGVGQSMYRIADYNDVNIGGTSVLLEELIGRPVERLVIASSMSIYGEGLYRGPKGLIDFPPERRLEQLKAADWELRDEDGAVLEPLPTPETKHPCLASVYALSKHDQERMCLVVGRAYGIPTVSLRFFNSYGPRQALSNPYTGVLAIFASRLLNGKPPLIFEDGRQRRDFVSVHDVAQACVLALESQEAVGQSFNIASGHELTVFDLAYRMARILGKGHIAPEVTGRYRVGDIRHCFADIARAREVLGYRPKVTLESGLTELAQWLEGQPAFDRSREAVGELTQRGLTV